MKKESIMKLRFVFAGMLFVGLAACGNKPPSCSDEKTIGLVKQIFFQSLKENQNMAGLDASLFDVMKRDLKLSVSSIRTVATDDKVGKITCGAVLETEFPSTAKAHLENFNSNRGMRGAGEFAALKVNGLVVSTDVQYSSQLTDDKKEQMVELGGFKAVVDLVSATSLYGAFKRESAPPAKAQPTPQAPSAEQSQASASSATKRTISNVTLQAYECGDTCQLRYADSSGQSHSAICSDTKNCDAWAVDPKRFAPMIGAKADLLIGKKFVPEGGITLDNVEEVRLLGNR